MWFVYILQCIDDSLYTGITNDLEKRFVDHQNNRGGRYTRSHKVIKIVYQQKLLTHSEALKREAEIKKWSRAKKLEFLNLEE